MACPLVTLAETKLYLGIASTDTSQDPKLQLMLDTLDTWLKAEFENYGIKAIKTDNIEEFQDGPGMDRVITKFRPVRNVDSVHVSDQQVFDATTLVPSTDYRVTKSTGIIRLVNQAAAFYTFPFSQPFGSQVFSRGVQNIRIVYDAGYDPTPNDIKLSLLTVIGKYQGLSSAGSSGGGAFSSERLGDYSYTIREGAAAAEGGLGASGAFMQAELRQLLDHYFKAYYIGST